MACRDRPELLDALSRAGRSLAPGGTLFLMEPVHAGFLSRVLDMGLTAFLGCMAEAGLDVKTVKPLNFWPTRIALAYLPLPRLITAPGFHVGNTLMKLPLLRRLGDYWAIEARVARGGPLAASAAGVAASRHPAGAAGEDASPEPTSAFGRDAGQARAAGEDAGQANASTEDTGQANASGEDAGQANATGEDAGQASAADEDTGQANASGEDAGHANAPGQASAAGETGAAGRDDYADDAGASGEATQ
jgi:hypothetical protein